MYIDRCIHTHFSRVLGKLRFNQPLQSLGLLNLNLSSACGKLLHCMGAMPKFRTI